MYTLPFVENKKRELKIDFDESETLRSFFDRKLTSLSKFTTLPFVNQVEIVMNDLPVEISCMFIREEKMLDNNKEILDFCDSIQYLVEHVYKPNEYTKEKEREQSQQSNKMQMKIFNADSETETSQFESVSVVLPQSSSSRGLGRGRGRGRGRSIARGVTGKHLQAIHGRDVKQMTTNN